MEGISRCCRDLYHQPFDRQKVIYICGGVGAAFLIVIVIITISLMSSSPSQPDNTRGSDALKNAPLIIGYNNFSQNIKAFRRNQISTFNLSADWKSDEQLKTCTTCQTDYPKLKAGKVAVQVWTASVNCTAQYKDSVSQTLEQIDVIQRFISSNPTKLSLATTSKGIETEFSKNTAAIGSMISIDGGHSIDGRLGVLRMYYQLGVRMMSLASACNTTWSLSYEATANSTKDTGLTAFGKIVVAEMNRLGMIIDLSGSSNATQLQVLNITKAPVVFSHSACANLTAAGGLNIPDDVLLKLKENKGLVMLTFSPKQLNSTAAATVNDVITHLNYLRTKIGASYIGIGGAYDLYETYPTGLSDISTIGSLFDNLYANSSWSLPQLEALAGKNFLSLLKTVESVRDGMSLTSGANETWEDQGDYNNVEKTCYSDFTWRYPPAPAQAPPPTSTQAPPPPPPASGTGSR
uniref:Dipeptidase n=1 Tax=Clastoptera arizonana TaxID=38151 RepID=A0A1B6DI86_9HEMI